MTVSANPTMYSATATALAREKMIPMAPPAERNDSSGPGLQNTSIADGHKLHVHVYI